MYGGYAAVSYSSLANGMLCTLQGNGNGTFGAGAVAGVGCDNNWSTWWVGSRTQWNVTKDFYMGVDVLYSNLQSASINATNVHSYRFSECLRRQSRRGRGQLGLPVPCPPRLLSLIG